MEVGYRSIDTAQAYFNEEGVGNAWHKSGIKREDLFLTTKVWVSNYAGNKASESNDVSLKKLQTDYIDLLLVHQCFGDYYNAYRAMEDALKAGKVRAIGVSNFYYDRFTDIAENANIKPAVNQIEVNVFAQQKRMQEICMEFGTHLMAWGPLAEGFNYFFKNPVLAEIGAQYKKSIAQVALRYLVQRDIIVIPKSVHKERMEQNFDIFDFKLSEADMNRINALDLGHEVVVNFEDPEQRLGLYEIVKKYKV